MTARELRDRMRADLRSGAVFDTAHRQAAAYLDSAFDRNVSPSNHALAALASFDEPLPKGPGDAEAIIDRLATHGSPATNAQIGGRFFGLVNGGALPVAQAAGWLAGAWDQNVVLHAVSPLGAKLEEVCERWLRELLGLPEDTSAGFVTGSSMAIFCGLAAARWRLLSSLGWDVNARGLAGAAALRIVTGRETHSAVLKAIGLLGFGTDCIEYVEVDHQGRLIAEAMPALDARTIVILQAGNVNSGAFDPIDAVCREADAKGAWVHVDGAFGLWAAASNKLRHLTDGMASAHSFSLDAHKTLNVTYDCGIVLCRDQEAITAAMQASGAYLPRTGERDGMAMTPEMSRRARGIELWAALAYLGRDGVDMLVTELHERAVQAGREFASAGFDVLNDIVFNQVVLGFDDDAEVQRIIQEVRASGECWIGASRWQGRPVIRFSVCSWATTPDDISRAVRAIALARQQAFESAR